MPEKRKKTIDAAADRQTMTELYETYEQKMFGIANAILHNDWQAEDAVHEAFVRMVPYLSRCKDVNDEKTKILIVRVIKSAAIDIYRKNKRENTYILDSEEDWIEDKHNPVEVYLATLSAGEMLKKIIGQLSSDDRKIIEMRCYDGMPVSDIGEILGISTDNVYKRLSRARKRVKEIIAKERTRMLNKNLDEWLYLTGMENALDELEKAEKNHTEVHRFSDSYRQKQTALLDSICAAEENDERMMFEIEKKNMDGKENKNQIKSAKHGWRKSTVAAALILLIGGVSVTTYAAGRYFLVDREQRGNVVSVNLNGESEKDSKVAVLSYQFGYVPEEYKEWQPRYYSKNGEYGGKGFYVMQWQGLDTTFEYLENRTKTTINGKEAYCYQMGEESNIKEAIQVLYNNEGAMYTLYSDDEDISMDELLKIAEGMIVTETGEYAEIISGEDVTDGNVLPEESIPANHMCQTGDTVAWATGDGDEGELTVKNIQVLTNIVDLSKEDFGDYGGEIAPFADESGNLKAINGVTDIKDENGIHEGSEENQVVLVKVSCKVVNTTEETQEYYMNTLSLKGIKELGNHVTIDYDMIPDYKNGVPEWMIYMTNAQYTTEDEREKSFFEFSLAPGESKDIDCAFLTYENSLKDTGLIFNPTGGAFGQNSEYIFGWKLQ
ncbi:MAG: sigma-70 family RNA polymerase sigma factor [Lachnospiraceae bacterium]